MARMTMPPDAPLSRGVASASDGALVRGQCSVESGAPLVCHRGGPYGAAATAQRSMRDIESQIKGRFAEDYPAAAPLFGHVRLGAVVEGGRRPKRYI